MSEQQAQRPEQRQERRVFTEEFKRDAVRLAKERGNGWLIGYNVNLTLKQRESIKTHQNISDSLRPLRESST